MRYALYARKSTEEDERQAQSIADQKRRCLELARSQGIHDIITFEEARSAKEEGRREFGRMLALVDSGEIEGILAWHPDRLSRNEMDGAAVTMRLRKGRLKNMAFAQYFFHNSPEGIMMLQIALSQSQYFSSKLSLDVKRGMQSKVEQGWYPHRAPAGYVNNTLERKGEKTISPDPRRFPLLRRAFDFVLSGGYPPLQVLRLLNGEWGYRSPRTGKHGDRPLSKAHFYRLLLNPFYAGGFVENGVLYPGKHCPMITKEEHRRIKEVLGVGDRIGPKRHVFPYTGVIHCRPCHAVITAQITTNRYGREYTYYRCLHCRGQTVSEIILQTQIDAEVDRIHVPEQIFLDWATEAVERFWLQDKQTDRSVYDQKLLNLKSVVHQLDNLLTALTKGLITDAEYQQRKAALQAERLLLQQVTEEVQKSAEQAKEAMKNLLTFLKNVRDWIDKADPEVQRACLRTMGSNFLLEGKKLLWEPHPLLQGVRNEYKGLHANYQAIKLNKTHSRSAKLAQLESVLLSLIA
jgi:site-specific DNA recombinase